MPGISYSLNVKKVELVVKKSVTQRLTWRCSLCYFIGSQIGTLHYLTFIAVGDERIPTIIRHTL